MKGKFSIILPVRNGGEYVKDCVKSILSQTYPDLHLQVLDNASNDGTAEWIGSLNDKRVSIYPSAEPLSIEENWKRALTVPKNEFVTLIGHDDVLQQNFLAVINEIMVKHPSASLYHTHFKYIDAKGKLIRDCKPMDEVQHAAEFLSLFLSNRIDSMGTGYVMRSVDYDSLGGIPASYPNLLFADFELWIELTRKSYKATAPQSGFSFRIHQSTTAISPDIKFHNAFDQFMHYLEKIKSEDKNLLEAVEKYALVFIDAYCKGLSHRLLRTPGKKREGQTVASFLGKCKEYANMLVPGNDYDPCRRRSIRLAKQIDSNFLTRGLFLLFKKIYSRPIYS